MISFLGTGKSPKEFDFTHDPSEDEAASDEQSPVDETREKQRLARIQRASEAERERVKKRQLEVSGKPGGKKQKPSTPSEKVEKSKRRTKKVSKKVSKKKKKLERDLLHLKNLNEKTLLILSLRTADKSANNSARDLPFERKQGG